MFTQPLVINQHAAQRMDERQFTKQDVAYVRRYGTKIHRAGALFHILLKRNVPPHLLFELSRLVDVVVVTERGMVTTVYYRRNALRYVKRKPKCREIVVDRCTRSVVYPRPMRGGRHRKRTVPLAELRPDSLNDTLF